ncbi:MAG TPA: translation initiation factor IF-1 [Candidatus Saccharimonadia bacterium]|nr:translation initiation factor IF-1 [Candidatus Saccharimonadia bacterium]
MTNKPDIFEVEGEVTETLPNLMFRVNVTSGPPEMVGKTILAKLSGKMKMFRIRVMLGDNLKLEVSKYDTTKGRITFRSK